MHHLDITRIRRAQKWRLSGEIHPCERAQRGNPTPLRRALLCARVHIRSGISESLDKLESSGPIHAVVRPMRPRNIDVAQIDGRPKRGLAVPVRGFDIRAPVDQQTRHRNLVVQDRHDERRNAIRIRLLDIRAGAQQELHRIEMTFARRVQQRSLRSGDRIPRATLRPSAAHDPGTLGARVRPRRTELRRLPRARLGIHISAMGYKQLGHVRVTATRGEHQCGLLVLEVARVDRRLFVQQRVDDIDSPLAGSHHQAGLAGSVC